jgi:hypothetical protein
MKGAAARRVEDRRKVTHERQEFVLQLNDAAEKAEQAMNRARNRRRQSAVAKRGPAASKNEEPLEEALDHDEADRIQKDIGKALSSQVKAERTKLDFAESAKEIEKINEALKDLARREGAAEGAPRLRRKYEELFHHRIPTVYEELEMMRETKVPEDLERHMKEVFMNN